MIDTVNSRIVKPRLKTGGIFSQIMQQAGQFGFGGKAERGGELFRQVRNVAKMCCERLPFASGFRQGFPILAIRSMRVKLHMIARSV